MDYLSQKNILKDKLTAFIQKGEGSIDQLAIEVLQFQLNFNQLYRDFFELLAFKKESIQTASQIPCLPISMMKGRKVSASSLKAEKVFLSSGTSGQIKSEHHITDIRWYDFVTLSTFRQNYGDLSNFNFLGLLPNYLEQPDSSLIHMINCFMQKARGNTHGFFSDSNSHFFEVLTRTEKDKRKTIIFGVTYALLDLSEKVKGDFPESFIIIETGGMKGRRKELVREELHSILTSGLNAKTIHSEYGMTELQSQAYSKGHGIFSPGPLLRVFIHELNDPLQLEKEQHTGLIHLIDLANFETMPFLATNDIGRRISNNQFEVLGRMDGSELRGCNLMYGNY